MARRYPQKKVMGVTVEVMINPLDINSLGQSGVQLMPYHFHGGAATEWIADAVQRDVAQLNSLGNRNNHSAVSCLRRILVSLAESFDESHGAYQTTIALAMVILICNPCNVEGESRWHDAQYLLQPSEIAQKAISALTEKEREGIVGVLRSGPACAQVVLQGVENIPQVSKHGCALFVPAIKAAMTFVKWCGPQHDLARAREREPLQP